MKFLPKIWKYLKIFLINRKLHLKNQLWPIIQIIFNLIEPIYDEKSFQIFEFLFNFFVFSSYLGQDGFIFHLEKLWILEFEL